MSESIKKNIEKTIKTTAALFAVVFLLLCINGCCTQNSSRSAAGEVSEVTSSESETVTAPVRRKRRRVENYSRLPSNMPATWQIQSVGY